MSLIKTSIVSMLGVSIKTRHDSYTDQFSRIFMVKLLAVTSFVVGVDWFHNKLSCSIPYDSSLTQRHVHSACWAQGIYIYSEMKERLNKSFHYGIPKDIKSSGLTPLGKLCDPTTGLYGRRLSRRFMCKPMKKEYFQQFQWMPIYIASLSILFYLPYILFCIINTDMISLQSSLKIGKVTAKDIVDNYFNSAINSKLKMHIRVMGNVPIKLLYFTVNLIAFLVTNNLLQGNYSSYGTKLIEWFQLDRKVNNIDFSNFYQGDIPKPGNVLFPSFGYCEFLEVEKGSTRNFDNKSYFLCEASTNVLYQYVFIVLWIAMIISITVSIIGIIFNILGHVINMVYPLTGNNPINRVYKNLSLRECEYLTYIRRMNIPLYGEVIARLLVDGQAISEINMESRPIIEDIL